VNKKFLLSMLLVAVAALALAACGGSDGDGGGEEDAVVTTIENSANSTDPADCEVYSTQTFLEQTQLETGRAALESCEVDAEDESNNPDSVEVENVKIGDKTASAEVGFDGGDYDGQTLAVGLVEKDGEWKLNSVDGFVDLDREDFIAKFEEGVDEAGVTPAQKSCIQKAIDGAGNSELETLATSPSEDLQNKLFGKC